jgi:hypothetical protein
MGQKIAMPLKFKLNILIRYEDVGSCHLSDIINLLSCQARISSDSYFTIQPSNPEKLIDFLSLEA